MTAPAKDSAPALSQKPRAGGPMAWMARNSVAANLLMVALIVSGLLMSQRIRKEVFPRIELDRISVTVPYPGASPREVEQGIILVIEEAVRPLDNVKEVTSVASEGVGSVTVELQTGANRNKALTDVKNAVDRIVNFPVEAERPLVNLPELKSDAISLVLYGDLDEKVMHATGEQIREEMLRLPEISYVELEGVRPLEISIEVAQNTLRAYGLTLAQIANQVRRTSLELPAGGVKTKGGEVLLRTAERRDLGTEFADVPILTGSDGSPLLLGAIADIKDGFAETDVSAAFDGKSAVQVRVYATGNQSPTEVAAAVKAYIKDLGPRLPPGLKVASWKDRSELYDDRMDLLLRNAAMGLILVLLILGMFLAPKLAFWVTMGIPISFLGSLILLPAIGISLNMISLFAFIVTLGMVVDDAIVVGENSFRMRKQGLSSRQAAIAGAEQVATPVFFSIATTVAAFTPLLLIPGTRGKFMFAIPVVVILVLLVSLIESFFILPAHLSHLAEEKPNQKEGGFFRFQKRFSRGVERFIETRYAPVARWAVERRWITLAVAIAIFISSIGLISGGRVKFIDFPREESDDVVAEAYLPFGTSVAETEKVMVRLIDSAKQVIAENGGDGICRGIYSMLGSAFSRRGSRYLGGHVTSVAVTLVPTDQRPIGSFAFSQKWREALGEVPGLEALVFDSSVGHGTSKPIDIQLRHQDLGMLEAAARDLATEMAAFPGVKDVEDGIELGKPQWDFTISPEGTAAGIQVADLALQVRSAFYGAEVLRQQRGRNELKVMVRLPRHERESLHSVEEMMIRTPSGGEMPLRQAASVREGRAYSIIQRTDGRRTVRVQAEVDEDQANPREIMMSIRRDVLPKLAARYPGLSMGSSGRQKEMQDFFAFLQTAFMMALIAMYVLIAIPLRSYLQPFFVVMMAIPFGFVGALLGHMLMGIDLSMISMMGFVALSGVVINDSIVLVTAANRFRGRGMGPVEAALAAAQQRFRPIVLTSLTTFGGLAPMIFETSVQARILIPMAVSLGFGVMFSTFIILLLVPALFVMIENLRIRVRSLRAPAAAATAGLVLLLATAAHAGSPAAEAKDAWDQITPGKEITLSQALHLADERNLSLAAARTDLDRAQADYDTAWSSLLPTLTGSMTFTHNDHADFASFGPEPQVVRRQDDLNMGLSLNLPLVNARAWMGVGLGDLGREVTQLGIESLRQTLLLSVAQIYYQALTAQSLIEVHRNQIRSSRRHLAIANIHHRSGTGRRLDVIRARTELITAREQLRAAHTALTNSRDALATLLGIEGLPLPADIPDMAAPKMTEQEMQAKAQQLREDLKLNRARLRLADKQLDTAWMQFLPSLIGSWRYTQQITDPTSLAGNDQSRWLYAITLSVPFYDHTRYAELDKNRAALNRARIEIQDAQQKARAEVRTTRRNYETAMSLVGTARTKTDLASQSLSLAETAYENGTGSSLDVTDARRVSRSAHIDLAVKRFESQLTLLKLLRSIGTDMRKLEQP